MAKLQNPAKAWRDFKSGSWDKPGSIDVFDFIQSNYQEHRDAAKFLTKSTPRTKRIWKACQDLEEEQRKKQIYEVETEVNADVDAFQPGFISKDDTLIVGLQTDKLFKRPVMYKEGIRNIRGALEAHGLKSSDKIDNDTLAMFQTHNDAVFDLYTR